MSGTNASERTKVGFPIELTGFTEGFSECLTTRSGALSTLHGKPAKQIDRHAKDECNQAREEIFSR